MRRLGVRRRYRPIVGVSLERRLFGEHVDRIVFVHEPIDAVAHFEYAAETDVVAGAVDTRRREFATGRRLAHALLARLGLDDGPLLPSGNLAPRWPEGATGSITHGAGRCAVAVARTDAIDAVGVDIEDDGPLSDELFESILTRAELEELTSDRVRSGRSVKLAFCAKEAAYKAIALRVGRMLDFHEVEIELGGDDFRARFDGTVLPGRFAFESGLVFASVVVAKDGVTRG